jgi:hypothetical protein
MVSHEVTPLALHGCRIAKVGLHTEQLGGSALLGPGRDEDCVAHAVHKLLIGWSDRSQRTA